MDKRFENLFNPDARYDWRAAIEAGLIVGAMVWLFSHGLPWFTSGMISPTFVGRDLKPPGIVDPYGSMLTVFALLAVSVCYALIIGLAVFRFRGMWSVAMGALVGFGLYLLNFAVFQGALPVDWRDSEASALVAHLVYAPIAAGLYKGLAARRTVKHQPRPTDIPAS